MKPRFKLMILFLFILCNVIAQNKFQYQTFTDSVVKDGFYQINLLPSIVAKCKPTLDDIRLFARNNKQISYLIKNGEIAFEQHEFVSFRKISEEYGKDSTYKILVENTKEKLIDNLVFILQNSMSNRSVDISGSYDKIHWYAIGDYIPLENKLENIATNITQTISLPGVVFTFFSIRFKEKQKDPILIEHIGTYRKKPQTINYFLLPNPQIIQVDSSNKSSYIQLAFSEKYNIDKLEIFASGAKLFNRNVFFITRGWKSDKFWRSGLLSSQHINSFDFLTFKRIDTLKFTIENNDNQPLKIDSVKAYQKAYALFAYLKAGQKYKLAFGNDSLEAPVYDISAFSDSIKNATLLLTSGITENKFASNETKAPANFNNKIWLWTAIIVVLLILLYFTSTMLKQINKKQQADF